MIRVRVILALFVFIVVPAGVFADINDDLRKAVENGQADTVQSLLDAGADANAKDMLKSTVLMLAAGAGHTEVLELLLGAGADVNAKDMNSLTALIWAALRGQTEAVRLLLAAGADMNAVDIQNKTAFMWAEERDFTETALLLNVARDAGNMQTEEAMIVDIKASSSLPPSGKHNYGPEQAFDSDPLSAWSEGAQGSGIKETIEVRMDREITVDAIEVMGGFFDTRYFKSNNRVKTLKVTPFYGDEEPPYYERTFVLKDEMTAQRFELGTNSRNNIQITMIIFEVTEVYKGEKWDDTCVSEIAFYREGERIALSFPALQEQAPEGFVLVKAGSFLMGSNEGFDKEKPVHEVSLSRSFFMSRHEVTQKQWREVMGSNPSYFKGDNLPVELISWFDAVEYCNRLSEKEGLTACYSESGDDMRCDFSANGYRLPSEAEWEYAARGGNKSKGYSWAGAASAEEVGWCEENSGKKTHEVGQKIPNEIGLHDMSGNVSEWCWDRFGEYIAAPQSDPRGPSAGSSYRVTRGGCWFYSSGYLRTAFRGSDPPTSAGHALVGFRPVRTAK